MHFCHMLPHPYDIIFCGMEIDHIYIRKINRNKTANLAVIVMCGSFESQGTERRGNLIDEFSLYLIYERFDE